MNFKTINQTAALGILPEYRMRQMLKQGKLPGIYSGTRYLVNVDALKTMLEEQTAQSIKRTDSRAEQGA